MPESADFGVERLRRTHLHPFVLKRPTATSAKSSILVSKLYRAIDLEKGGMVTCIMSQGKHSSKMFQAPFLSLCLPLFEDNCLN